MKGNVVYSLFKREVNFIIMKRILPFFIALSFLSAQLDFNEGPYGSEYFDIAGPFALIDLNMELGDVNSDNTVNVLDIIETVNFVLGTAEFTSAQIAQADLNFDGTVNILDIIQLANMILSGEFTNNADLNGDNTLNILDIIALVNIILDN